MGTTSPSALVRARRQRVQRVADRAAFVREQARDAPVEEPVVEEEAPAEDAPE